MYATGEHYGNGEAISAALDNADEPMRDAGYVTVRGGLGRRLLLAAYFRM